jgi:hypothetical protein
VNAYQVSSRSYVWIIEIALWLVLLVFGVVDGAIAAVINDTGYLSEAAALDALATHYMAGGKTSAPQIAEIGTKSRRLFKLHEDQHQNLTLAVSVDLHDCLDGFCEPDELAWLAPMLTWKYRRIGLHTERGLSRRCLTGPHAWKPTSTRRR